jgi:argininosuccinate synthase
MAYAPEKLSMEKVASAFSPEDRIGALEMQNLSVQDNRDFLVEHLQALSKLPAGAERPMLAALLSSDKKL